MAVHRPARTPLASSADQVTHPQLDVQRDPLSNSDIHSSMGQRCEPALAVRFWERISRTFAKALSWGGPPALGAFSPFNSLHTASYRGMSVQARGVFIAAYSSANVHFPPPVVLAISSSFKSSKPSASIHRYELWFVHFRIPRGALVSRAHPSEQVCLAIILSRRSLTFAALWHRPHSTWTGTSEGPSRTSLDYDYMRYVVCMSAVRHII